VTDLHCHLAGCFVALDWFGRVSEFNRMRALRNGQDLQPHERSRLQRTLTWLDGRPVSCLPPQSS
jgi:hypothetical protein